MNFVAKSLYLEGDINVQTYNSWNLRQKICLPGMVTG